MGHLTKVVYGMFLMYFLFSFAQIASFRGIALFASGFFSVGGLIIVLSIGALEAAFVFYE